MFSAINDVAKARAKLVAAKALAFGIRRMSIQEDDRDMARLADGIHGLVDQALASLGALESRARIGRRP